MNNNVMQSVGLKYEQRRGTALDRIEELIQQSFRFLLGIEKRKPRKVLSLAVAAPYKGERKEKKGHNRSKNKGGLASKPIT